MNPKAFYTEQFNKFENDLNKTKHRSHSVSIYRLVTFLLFIASVVSLTVIETKTLAWVGLAISLVTFLLLVKYQLSLEKSKTILKPLTGNK